MIKDDSGDLARRALWLAGGCAALGAVLVLRTVGFTAIPDWAAWSMLVLSLLIVPAAVETGWYNLDLTFGGVSLVASVLGLVLYGIGWLTGEGRGELLDLGPIFALVGFAVGTVSNLIMWWDVLQDLKELAKEARDPQLAADLAAGVPLRKCPQCRKQIPAYAQACRYCKAILVKT